MPKPYYVHAVRNGQIVNLPADSEEQGAAMVANLERTGWTATLKSVGTEAEDVPRHTGRKRSRAEIAADKEARHPLTIPKATDLHYRKGMSFAEFQKMLDERRARNGGK